MRKLLIAANWKMNGSSEEVSSFTQSLSTAKLPMNAVDVLFCPPVVYASSAISHLGNANVQVGAQDCNENEAGAYTGETSPGMLKDIGCQFVIVGHSERRQFFGDTDDRVALKFAAAIKTGLTPILCVGESLIERENGLAEETVQRQLDAVLKKSEIKTFTNAVIAYEPVWAIGTGKTATPEQAEQMHSFIRQLLASRSDSIAKEIRVIYGGSVKPNNAADLFSRPNIDGGLVGGASLKATDFIAICEAGV